MEAWLSVRRADRRATAPRYRLDRCRACGTAVTVGRSRHDATGLYRGGAYAAPPAPVDLLLEPLRRLGDAAVLRALGPLAPGSRVIEIGSGDGRLLRRLAEQGHSVVGIEPYAAQGDTPLPVRDTAVEALGAPTGVADIAVLWHVLEHLDDPALGLRRAVEMLGRHGRVVVSVPNLDSLQARIGGPRWFHLDVPRHAVHFTRSGLMSLFRRCGLVVTRVCNLVLDQNLLGAAQTLLNRLTREQNVAFRTLKRDLADVPTRDLVVSALAAVPAALAGSLLETAAMAAGLGGALVVHAERTAPVSTTIIVPSWNGARRLERLLPSLGTSSAVVVVDNGSTDDTAEVLARRFPDVDVIRFARNHGYSKAINRAAAVAASETIVLLNDDCVCEQDFAERLAGALDPSRGVAMAAGVLLEAHDPTVVDSAGIELDDTLLVFDYLNGQPISVLTRALADPLGPSGAAAAFDRAAFLECGGFDERLFAYWEDVDLVLRLRLAGARCVLVPDARAVHSHSATLGSGSARKNYLTGFGRSYVLRKWGVLRGQARGRRGRARSRHLRRAARGRPDAGRDSWSARRLARRRRNGAASVPGSSGQAVAPLHSGRASPARAPAPPPATRNDVRMTGGRDVTSSRTGAVRPAP